MLFDDTYLTITAACEGTFKDRGSKFIAFAYPIKSEAEVKPILARLKAEHTKANHQCFALRLTPDRSVFRINDDGEPSGTAGRPILNTLLSKNLTNVLVVVVRYFGGTLLGVPGLINAYRSATEEALKSAKIAEKNINDVYGIRFDYSQMNDVMRIVKNENLAIIHQQFDAVCEISVEVRKSLTERALTLFNGLQGIKISWLYTA
ncbi:YigZ family protein [Mucilaginibacter sp. PPCGB 2223]|uniref:IMPACT family protein n=1 Tax=Mucilaginibacter sp. PPCGB 2223 TaxID=1886027 RepID=UPI0008240E78|nr:YigZ family protein [Mucilaginibacter sp. PPCGB 2223]OCX53424.1 YigZ family protein [Mucilaginibacter sp. PPCGB 2223]